MPAKHVGDFWTILSAHSLLFVVLGAAQNGTPEPNLIGWPIFLTTVSHSFPQTVPRCDGILAHM